MPAISGPLSQRQPRAELPDVGPCADAVSRDQDGPGDGIDVRVDGSPVRDARAADVAEERRGVPEHSAAQDEREWRAELARALRADSRVVAHPGTDGLDDGDRDAVTRLRLVEHRVGEAGALRLVEASDPRERV